MRMPKWWRHHRAPRVSSTDGSITITGHWLDGVFYVDRTFDAEACRYDSEEWDGYYIGERWCWTHGGHSEVADLNHPCPRSVKTDG